MPYRNVFWSLPHAFTRCMNPASGKGIAMTPPVESTVVLQGSSEEDLDVTLAQQLQAEEERA